MAAKHGLRRRVLSRFYQLSANRTVWPNQSAAKGGSISSREHRRGEWAVLPQGVCEAPVDSPGIDKGSRDSPENRRETGFSGATSTLIALSLSVEISRMITAMRRTLS